MPTVLVGQFEPCVTALGPGHRSVVWVQGCPFRCPGCCSPHFLERGQPQHEIHSDALIGLIRAARERYGIEGISLSGGEPFAQARALAPVAAACRQLGLSTLAWTGYTLEQLTGATGSAPPPHAGELLAGLDVLIDGPFRQDRPPTPLRGSDNQRVHRLTERYSEADLTGQAVEVRVRPDGDLQAYGIVPDWWTAVSRLFGLELNPESAASPPAEPTGLNQSPAEPPDRQ